MLRLRVCAMLLCHSDIITIDLESSFTQNIYRNITILLNLIQSTCAKVYSKIKHKNQNDLHRRLHLVSSYTLRVITFDCRNVRCVCACACLGLCT